MEQLPHLGAQQLRLEVYDQDQIGSDDLIGVTTLELPDLQALHISPYLAISRYLAISPCTTLERPDLQATALTLPGPTYPYLNPT